MFQNGKVDYNMGNLILFKLSIIAQILRSFFVSVWVDLKCYCLNLNLGDIHKIEILATVIHAGLLSYFRVELDNSDVNVLQCF